MITGSVNGRICIWDFLEGTLLRTIDVSHPIYHISAHENHQDFIFIAVTRPTQAKTKKASRKQGEFSRTHFRTSYEFAVDEDTGLVWRVSLRTRGSGDNPDTPFEILKIGKTRTPTGLGISVSGSWLVATAGHKSYVASLSSDKPRFTKYISPERITCLALHPTEDYFATGDSKGVVRLWYCLDGTPVHAVGVEKRTQTASLHWHAHSVASLAFSTNGAYLLSGGEESVLVAWQLETGKKEFVPRLGAAINTVSVLRGAQEEYMCCLVDGTFVFITGGSLQVKRSFSRIRLGW